MKWKIKYFNELTTNELYKIIKKRIDIFVVEQDCPYPECDDKDLNSYHLYSCHGDKLAAYSRILLPGVSYKEASIGRVLVDKDYRGRGLGRELLKKAMDYIINEMGERKIRVSAQKYLLEFYKDMGFRVVSDVYMEDGIPHLEMLYKQNEFLLER